MSSPAKDRGCSKAMTKVNEKSRKRGDYDYRVLTDGQDFWVGAVSYDPFKVLGSGPVGSGRDALLKDWTHFNMALHKPVLNFRTGKECGAPLVGKYIHIVDEKQSK